MKILKLPHLPSKIDVVFYKFIKQFLIIPPNCFIKVTEMSKVRPKLTPIDLNTIFGVVRNNNVDLVRDFINKHDESVVNLLDKDGFSPMHWAVLEGNIETVNYLLELDADFNNFHSCAQGQGPIHWACIKGRLDMVAVLLEKGVDIDLRDKRGYTPVLAACQYGHQGLVAFLVSRGAKLEIEDYNGDTCLHWAAYKAHPDLTRLLIIYGVYPKKIDVYGQTVLHLACIGGNLNIVQQLIEQDAIDTEIRDKNGKKAIDLARAASHSDIVDLIERHYQNRRKYKCNWKALMFGPVGNSRTVILCIHLIHWLYQYPMYFFDIAPETWTENFDLNMAYIALNIIMWTFFYLVYWTEPGFIRQDTEEYKHMLRRFTFNSRHFTQEDWNKNLSRLCHTCKCVKPLRASHCRYCNRCVLAFDHHCPYIHNCVGYNNRIYFFFFVLFCNVLQLVVLYFAYVVYTLGKLQTYMYPGIVFVTFYAIMVSTLTFGALMSAAANITTNEMQKKKKYDYLQMSIGANGLKKSLFNRGIFFNCKYYFHLVEPPSLEVEGFESTEDYIV